MIRNLKALGLALVAVFAMSALVASAAQAQFTSEAAGVTTVAASGGTQTFKAAFGSIKCKKVVGSGSFTSPSNELTGEDITYTECSALAGTLPATVDFPSTCHYLFTSNTTITKKEEEAGKQKEGVHLTCSTGSITITIFPAGTLPPHNVTPVCTFHIFGTQTFPLTYTNITVSAKMAVEVSANEVSVATSHEGELCGTGSETAKYTGSFQATGSSGGKATGITIS